MAGRNLEPLFLSPLKPHLLDTSWTRYSEVLEVHRDTIGSYIHTDAKPAVARPKLKLGVGHWAEDCIRN